LIHFNPNITFKDLTAAIYITTRAVGKIMSKHKAERILERIGSNKGGYGKALPRIIINEKNILTETTRHY